MDIAGGRLVLRGMSEVKPSSTNYPDETSKKPLELEHDASRYWACQPDGLPGDRSEAADRAAGRTVFVADQHELWECADGDKPDARGLGYQYRHVRHYGYAGSGQRGGLQRERHHGAFNSGGRAERQFQCRFCAEECGKRERQCSSDDGQRHGERCPFGEWSGGGRPIPEPDQRSVRQRSGGRCCAATGDDHQYWRFGSDGYGGNGDGCRVQLFRVELAAYAGGESVLDV